jgi:hypothetical protein
MRRILEVLALVHWLGYTAQSAGSRGVQLKSSPEPLNPDLNGPSRPHLARESRNIQEISKNLMVRNVGFSGKKRKNVDDVGGREKNAASRGANEKALRSKK